jgi:hypothetical protein
VRTAGGRVRRIGYLPEDRFIVSTGKKKTIAVIDMTRGNFS